MDYMAIQYGMLFIGAAGNFGDIFVTRKGFNIVSVGATYANGAIVDGTTTSPGCAFNPEWVSAWHNPGQELPHIVARGSHLWDRIVDAESSSIGRSVRLDSRGGVLMAGVIDGYSDLSGAGVRRPIGDRDAFVLRYDAWGCPRYDVVLGGPLGDDVGAIALGTDRVALAGFFSGTEASFGGGLRSSGDAPAGFVVVFAESDVCCAPVEALCGTDGSCCMDAHCDGRFCALAGESD